MPHANNVAILVDKLNPKTLTKHYPQTDIYDVVRHGLLNLNSKP
jgi:hypothetical protein